MGQNLVSLEQWRALVAVVDAGGYAQAAEALNKSQSAVTYAVKKLESLLGVEAFTLDGRRAVLTPVGRLLVQRARVLIDDAARLERSARSLSAGWEAELEIAVEALFPTWLMIECLAEFGDTAAHTRIEWYETILGGTQDALLDGAALALTPHVPQGFTGEAVFDFEFVPVAHPDHPLHALGRALGPRDLRRHRHIVVRESGRTRDRPLSVQAEQRWTVSHMPTSIGAVCRGHGYAWLPAVKIRRELEEGQLLPLPMRGGGVRRATMYLVLADPDGAGPGALRLADIVRRRCDDLGPGEVSADWLPPGATP